MLYKEDNASEIPPTESIRPHLTVSSPNNIVPTSFAIIPVANISDKNFSFEINRFVHCIVKNIFEIDICDEM